jgi:hypothetical protein
MIMLGNIASRLVLLPLRRGRVWVGVTKISPSPLFPPAKGGEDFLLVVLVMKGATLSEKIAPKSLIRSYFFI